MFKKLTMNIGDAIKKLAKVIYYINIVLACLSLPTSLIIGIFLMSYSMYRALIILVCLGIGLAACLVFLLVAVINTMIIYGFGELISSSIITSQNTTNN